MTQDLSSVRAMTFRQALNETLRAELIRDESVFLIGEEIGVFDGSYKITAGLLAEPGGLVRPHPRAQGARPLYPGRREGAPDGRNPRRRPRHLPGEPCAVQHQGRRTRWGSGRRDRAGGSLSLIHISEPTRQAEISYAVF